MKKWFFGVGALALLVFFASTQTCLRTGFQYGLWLDECPDGELRQTIHVSAPSVARGGEFSVSVDVIAHYTTGNADVRKTAPLKRFTANLSLTGGGEPRPLTPKKGWVSSANAQTATLTLPQVNDGEYQLRTEVTSQLGKATLEVPVPLYAPARVHVLTDRPLYEPGNTVKFRALALKSSDLSPLDERPGVWRISDPNGEVLLEERANAGAWGVVSGSFPLDRSAASGTWQVSWSSGDASQSRAFTVKPFTLPRFSLEASAVKPFYRRNERPTLKGSVKYASGAPVSNAKVSLSWSINGDWPAPLSWSNGSALPQNTRSGADGTFTVELPSVPDDLQKQCTLSAALSAIDASGDVAEGSGSVLLSEDLIQVTAVTELADGLVEGFNNRMYLRATTADGRVLEGVSLNVKRLWEPTDKGTEAKVDEDGVASLQVDPGPAVNVVIPAMPFRPPPPVDPVTRVSLIDALSENPNSISLADRLSFDQVEKRLEPCARYVGNQESVNVGALVMASGAVSALATGSDRLNRCVRDAMGALRFEPGQERLLQATFNFNDDDLPNLIADHRGLPTVPPNVSELISDSLADVRDCLPPTITSGTFSRMVTWRYETGSREVSLTWVPNPKGARYADSVLACVQGRLAKLTLPRASTPDDDDVPLKTSFVGITMFSVDAPEKYEDERPQETVMTGYEFLITAKKGKEVIGTTKLLMTPGQIPRVRLRASSQIVDPGATVTVELLRGPDFEGELPEKLHLEHGYQRIEAAVDAEKHTASFELPKALEGWASAEWLGARVFIFVRPQSQLNVTVAPEKERYAPGQVAQLGIETTIGGVAGPAAVGLFGVDQSLAQLAPLAGADELSGLRPTVTSGPAFGGLDAQALTMGRVRGANAAAATLLRVTAMPPPPEIDRAVSVQGLTVFDPNESLVDRFYVVLQELHVQVREWESSAPAAEKMKPQTMAKLWGKALTAIEARKESARDAWGRTLRLHRLPADLLSLTEPRQVVIDGTRLPEDSENWSMWVAKEQP